jgi:hypothetical protein
LALNQFGRQRGQSIVLIVSPTEFDRDVFTFDIAGFCQTLAECAHTGGEPLR